MPHGPHDTPQPTSGLRARNLRRNRAEVSDVALGLFAERGFDAVTVEDIARAAGISRRTFFRYFDSKEDAALPYEAERLELLRAVLADRPDGEPLMESIRRAAVAITQDPGSTDRVEVLQRLRIVQEHPALHARLLELQWRWEVEVRDVIAEHLGVDPATSMTARVVAGAAIAACRAAADMWLAGDGGDELADLFAEAFDVLDAGLVIGERPAPVPDRVGSAGA